MSEASTQARQCRCGREIKGDFDRCAKCWHQQREIAAHSAGYARGFADGRKETLAEVRRWLSRRIERARGEA
jgi:hypothetical protein